VIVELLLTGNGKRSNIGGQVWPFESVQLFYTYLPLDPSPYDLGNVSGIFFGDIALATYRRSSTHPAWQKVGGCHAKPAKRPRDGTFPLSSVQSVRSRAEVIITPRLARQTHA
jgi:hypothetical protein